MPRRQLRRGAAFSLIPLTSRAKSILDLEANGRWVSRVPRSDSLGLEFGSLGLEIGIEESGMQDDSTLVTIGQTGDIRIPKLASAIQCSIRRFQTRFGFEFMLVDLSHAQDTTVGGQRTIPLRSSSGGTRQVLLDRDINMEIRFGGVRMDLYRFRIVWHNGFGGSWTGSLLDPGLAWTSVEPTGYAEGRTTRIVTDPGPNIQYVLRRSLGQGSFGQVLAVCNAHTGDVFAMKRIPMSRPGSYNWELVKREVDAMRRCRHEHVLDCTRYQREGAFATLFTPIADGTVEDLLHSQVFVQSPELADQLFRDMVAALVCVHDRRVVHRDIKPANILYTVGGDGYHFFLGDFGLAVNADQARTRVGTPMFLAPEISGTSTVRGGFNPTVDIWSLFVTMACVVDTARLRLAHPGNWMETLRQVAVGDRLFHFADMIDPDPELRPSAAQLLDRISGGSS